MSDSPSLFCADCGSVQICRIPVELEAKRFVHLIRGCNGSPEYRAAYFFGVEAEGA